MAAHFSPSCLGLMGKLWNSVDLVFQILFQFFLNRWVTSSLTQISVNANDDISNFSTLSPLYYICTSFGVHMQVFEFQIEAQLLIQLARHLPILQNLSLQFFQLALGNLLTSSIPIVEDPKIEYLNSIANRATSTIIHSRSMSACVQQKEFHSNKKNITARPVLFYA